MIVRVVEVSVVLLAVRFVWWPLAVETWREAKELREREKRL